MKQLYSTPTFLSQYIMLTGRYIYLIKQNKTAAKVGIKSNPLTSGE